MASIRIVKWSHDDQSQELKDKPSGFSHPWWVVAGCVVVAPVGAGVAIYALNQRASEVGEAVYTIASLAASVAALMLVGIGQDAFRRWRSERRRFTSEGGSKPGRRSST
jgi:hypothetical protein